MPSFILVVSSTPPEKVKRALNVKTKEESGSMNVLFQKDGNYIDKLILK